MDAWEVAKELVGPHRFAITEVVQHAWAEWQAITKNCVFGRDALGKRARANVMHDFIRVGLCERIATGDRVIPDIDNQLFTMTFDQRLVLRVNKIGEDAAVPQNDNCRSRNWQGMLLPHSDQMQVAVRLGYTTDLLGEELASISLSHWDSDALVWSTDLRSPDWLNTEVQEIEAPITVVRSRNKVAQARLSS